MKSLKPLGLKGQITAGVADNMLALLVIVAIAFITIQVAASLDTNVGSELTGDGLAAKNNFSGGLWDSYQLMSLTPYLIGALVVISLVVGFAQVIGVGRGR